MANLRHAVLDAPATTDPALRAAAAAGDPLPEPWEPYAATVRDASYRVTDADVDRLTAAGCTEDQIFEVTVAAAVGAALRSFEAGRTALGQKTTLTRGPCRERNGCRPTVRITTVHRKEEHPWTINWVELPAAGPPRPVPSTAAVRWGTSESAGDYKDRNGPAARCASREAGSPIRGVLIHGGNRASPSCHESANQ